VRVREGRWTSGACGTSNAHAHTRTHTHSHTHTRTHRRADTGEHARGSHKLRCQRARTRANPRPPHCGRVQHAQGHLAPVMRTYIRGHTRAPSCMHGHNSLRTPTRVHGPRTVGGCSVSRGMKVMRPALARCSSSVHFRATSAESTTTWNSELPGWWQAGAWGMRRAGGQGLTGAWSMV